MKEKGIYRHFKGNLYCVLGSGTGSEGERYVIYRQLYGNHGYWIRPFEMFFSCKEQDGKQIRRFSRIEDSKEALPEGAALEALRLTHSETLESYRITVDAQGEYHLIKA